MAKTVQFSDTYDLNYFDLSKSFNNSLHPNNQLPLNPNAPMFHSTTNPAKTHTQDTPTVTAPTSHCKCALSTHPLPSLPVGIHGFSAVPTSTSTSLTVPFTPVTSVWGRGCRSSSEIQPFIPQAKPPPQETQNTGQMFNSTMSRYTTHSKHLGKTVREWKIKFSGYSKVSIEEFLTQVEENRRLDRLSDDELLDSMTPLFEAPALFWFRALRPSWRTFEEFKLAAMKAYSKCKRDTRSLTVEAYNRTQGPDEPVLEYMVSLLTILKQFDHPWSEPDQINLIIDNLLPELKKKMKIFKGIPITMQQLLEKAQEVEDDEKGYWRPPPPADQSILPEAAYQPRGKTTKAKPSGLSSLGEKSSPVNEVELEKMLNRIIDRRVKELGVAKPPAAPASNKNSAEKLETATKETPSDSNGNSPRGNYRGRGRGGRRGWGRPGGNRALTITPRSDQNKSRPAGPDGETILCWGCSWPGYTKATCPECSLKETKPETSKNATGSQ